VRLVRRAVDHLLGIAVIGGDDDLAADRAHRLDHATDASVQHLDGLRGGFHVAGMPHHVAVGVIADDGVILAAQDRGFELVGHFKRAHFRFQVVSRDFGRGHENAVFAGIGLFPAAAEKIGDVRVFFGLGDAQLPEPQIREVFAETVVDDLRRVGARQMKVFSIAAQRNETGEFGQINALEAAEGFFCQGARDLAGAVGAKIHEHHRITVPHGVICTA